MTYLSPKGGVFSFTGWTDEDNPLTCFDRGNYLSCLHGCMLALSLTGNAWQARLAIADDGLLHELLHLATGVDTCTCTSTEELRAEIAGLQNYIEEMLCEYKQKAIQQNKGRTEDQGPW